MNMIVDNRGERDREQKKNKFKLTFFLALCNNSVINAVDFYLLYFVCLFVTFFSRSLCAFLSFTFYIITHTHTFAIVIFAFNKLQTIATQFATSLWIFSMHEFDATSFDEPIRLNDGHQCRTVLFSSCVVVRIDMCGITY